MSSEPEKYPIEASVYPLVYELAQTTGIEPCWSCEGHCYPSGTIFREPQVWMYIHSFHLVSRMGAYVAAMVAKGQLHGSWKLVPCSGAPAIDAYRLHPTVDTDSDQSRLKELQKDLRTLADSIADALQRAPVA